MFDADGDTDSRGADSRGGRQGSGMHKIERHDAGISRRAFLRTGAGVALVAGLPGWLSGCVTRPGGGSGMGGNVVPGPR